MNELVSIVMGSDSDLEVMQECADVLKEFGVSYEMQVLSAHRTMGSTRNIFMSSQPDRA